QRSDVHARDSVWRNKSLVSLGDWQSCGPTAKYIAVVGSVNGRVPMNVARCLWPVTRPLMGRATSHEPRATSHKPRTTSYELRGVFLQLVLAHLAGERVPVDAERVGGLRQAAVAAAEDP